MEQAHGRPVWAEKQPRYSRSNALYTSENEKPPQKNLIQKKIKPNLTQQESEGAAMVNIKASKKSESFDSRNTQNQFQSGMASS